MKIAYIHFGVEDARAWRSQFCQVWGFESRYSGQDATTRHERVVRGSVCFVFSSPLGHDGPVARYLQQHPAGVVDVAFVVSDLQQLLSRAEGLGIQTLLPFTTDTTDTTGLLPYGPGLQAWAQLPGWGPLKHTVFQGERSAVESMTGPSQSKRDWYVDHVVLNVAKGELDQALQWYSRLFAFEPQQQFQIETPWSGLRSRVLLGPLPTDPVQSRVQFPINEPTSRTSQIQEFIDLNRGAGIQHLALGCENLPQTIAQLRQEGIAFLDAPVTYYQQLRQRADWGAQRLDWEAIARQQILVDWQPESPRSPLLQIFTHPLFSQPTFFLELIERYSVQGDRKAQGFGEGNFRALFEAIEREQVLRSAIATTVSANGDASNAGSVAGSLSSVAGSL